MSRSLNHDTSTAMKFADNLQFTQLIIKSFISFNAHVYVNGDVNNYVQIASMEMDGILNK